MAARDTLQPPLTIAVAESIALIGQALRAALLLKPAAVARPLPPAGLLLAALLHLAVGLVIDALTVAAPREFNLWALAEYSLPVLLALFGAGMAATLLGRPTLWLRLAALALIAAVPWQIGWAMAGAQVNEFPQSWVVAPFCGYSALFVLNLMRWAGIRALHWRSLLAATQAGVLTGLALILLAGSSWWWPQWPDDEPEAGEPRGYSAEALLHAQPQAVATAIAALTPQQPQQVDLYAIGFAGDGGEAVFSNEVAHFQRMMAGRFDSPGHSITLINAPVRRPDAPLATLSNLRQAIAGVGQTMDRDEDILLLMLTSHGSEDHQLYVAQDDLPLDQIGPDDLREALDAAGIRWRVLIVSACYSGGFIEPLADPHTLILTAARADRTSFGCGSDSEITWFGQALLAEALNQTTDFIAAFETARKAVRKRERELDERRSYPQISVGSEIAERLKQWHGTQHPGPAVAFEISDPLKPNTETAQSPRN